MSAEQQKATAFVSRLLANPALNGQTPLQCEEQIIQFLHTNAAQLAPTLSSAPFFPGVSWSQIISQLLEALMAEVDKTLVPDLERLVSNVRFAFVNFLRQQTTTSEQVREQVLAFLKNILTKMEARRTFTGAYAALAFGFPERYMDAIWARKSYIHFELTKVQRLKLGKDDTVSMIQATLLLKPVVNLVTAGSVAGHETASGIVQSQFAEKVFAVAKRQLPLVPDPLLKSGVNSNVSCIENRFIEATSRLAGIFSARARNYQPSVRVDRGADSPDKSWFSVARRNYNFYGFDVKILDELYSIAAENGW